MRVQLELCFAQAVLVISRVSDAFEKFPIQHSRHWLWVFLVLESYVILLRGQTQSCCLKLFLEGIRSFCIILRWSQYHPSVMPWIIRRVQSVKYLDVYTPLLRVQLELCFAQAVLVIYRVSDAFEKFPIQQPRHCSWVFLVLESYVILLRGHTLSCCLKLFLEGIRSFCIILWWSWHICVRRNIYY